MVKRDLGAGVLVPCVALRWGDAPAAEVTCGATCGENALWLADAGSPGGGQVVRAPDVVPADGQAVPRPDAGRRVRPRSQTAGAANPPAAPGRPATPTNPC